MTAPERKNRGQRTTAVTCGVMSEIVLGTVLLVWTGSPSVAAQTILGRTGSIAAVAGGMAILAPAMVAAILAARLNRTVLIAVVALSSLALAMVGAIALGQLQSEPGTGIPLVFAWLLTIPLALQIGRASRSRARD